MISKPKWSPLRTLKKATPMIWSLIVDGVNVRTCTTEQDARIKTRMIPNTYTDAIYILLGNISITDASNTTTSLSFLPRGTRTTCVAWTSWTSSINHEGIGRIVLSNGWTEWMFLRSKLIDDTRNATISRSTTSSILSTAMSASKLAKCIQTRRKTSSYRFVRTIIQRTPFTRKPTTTRIL